MRLKVSVTLAAAAVLAILAFTAVSAAAAHARPIVGRWQTLRTCEGLVVALRKFGLARLGVGVVGSDYFPKLLLADLAKKQNLCSGAKPQLHWHFFTRDGKFGSIDQHGNQVDDGTYKVLGAHTVRINDGKFRFRIKGKTLRLTPLLTRPLKQKALADPLAFSTAGWMVAVSYFGHPWRRVACRQWC